MFCPNKIAVGILNTTRTISILDSCHIGKEVLIEYSSVIFNLCRVDVGWRIVDNNQSVIKIDLSSTSSRHINKCIRGYRSKCVVNRSNDPSLEGIRLIEACNCAVDKESVSHS